MKRIIIALVLSLALVGCTSYTYEARPVLNEDVGDFDNFLNGARDLECVTLTARQSNGFRAREVGLGLFCAVDMPDDR